MDRYAFWAYDAYPFVISGKIDKNHPTKANTYSIEGWGEFWIEPRFVLHGDKGKAAHDTLLYWRNEYRKTLASITDVYMERLEKVATEHGVLELVSIRLRDFKRDKELEEAKEACRVAEQT